MNRVQRGAIVGITLALSTSLSGAVYASGLQAPKKAVKVVEVSSKYAFKAKKITITAGTKVTWTNTTDAAHTVTSTGHPPAKFNKQLATGAKVSITFTKKGTYHYFCAIHPYMVGTILVK
jgi:plastocyanin